MNAASNQALPMTSFARADRLSGLTGAVGRLVAWWQARRLASATYRELMMLDDRCLADIGIHRGQIRMAAAEGAVPNRQVRAEVQANAARLNRG